MNKDLVVIGHTGYVGRATAYAFNIEQGFSRSSANVTLEQVSKCHYIFICLPTPTINGECDTKAIFEIVKQIESYPRYADSTYIIRSTVYPGFSDYLMNSLKIDRVVSNPEFLSEDTWKEDSKNPKMIVIGGRSTKHIERVKGLYAGRYKYCKPVITDNKTAEIIKYAFNTWFTTKVIFNNEVYNYCQQTGANYETVKTALSSHPWGMKNHNVIHYKGKRGVHGHCLHKDTEAFATATGSPFFKMLMERNKTYV